MASVASKIASTLVSEEDSARQDGQHPTPVTSAVASSDWLYTAANWATWGLGRLIHALDGLRSTPPSPYLAGNYAPLTDVGPAARLFADLSVVQGALPDDLDGAYVRTGPNPAFKPEGNYHWFDGDGCVHATRVGGGHAAYAVALVDTTRARAERRAGYAACGKIGDAEGVAGLAHIALSVAKRAVGVLPAGDGLGTANTALAFHAGRLLALHEGDLPYHLKIACNGLLNTVGRLSAVGIGAGGGAAPPHPAVFTAHPKVDPVTGEMFAFGYSVSEAPWMWFYRLDAGGRLAADVPVPGLRGPMMAHDCALTEHYMVFADVPMFFKPELMVKQGSLPFEFDGVAPLRLGVMDRGVTSPAAAEAAMRWFTLDPLMCFHVANAWEVPGSAGRRVEVALCAFRQFSLGAFTLTGPASQPYLYRAVLDLDTGAATCEQLCDVPGDFPVVPPSLVGRPCRFAYLAAVEPDAAGMPTFYGLLKVDLAAAGPGTAVAGLIRHGAKRTGGEASFVPRRGAVAEDDGYLVTYVHDGGSNLSELVVYDARTMAAQPVARVALRRRVPHGFHGAWVTAEQLEAQLDG